MGSASRALVVLSSSYFIMVLASLLFFLPALALSSKDSVAIVPAEDLKVCEYFDARIVRLREIVNKELGPDVDIGSDLYTTLGESKLCDTVGYIAIPECVANNGGDECVARKTSELIRKTLRAAIKAEKIKAVPSGEKFFATCKHIGYKNVLKTFKSARTLMSPECGLPGLGGGRSKRSLDLLPALLLGGSYDPSSIWFQYFLCKDIDLYCYFFTQGWTQGQYGQYYLYDNLLDDTTGLFAGSTDSNLATIALLGGLGGGIGQPSGYYPSYGAHAAAPVQGRKRRDSEVDDQGNERKRRTLDCDDKDCPKRKRQTETVDPNDKDDNDRKRRSVDCAKTPEHLDCPNRKRRSVDCAKTPKHPDCPERKRRSVDCAKTPEHPVCPNRKRRSVDCAKTPEHLDCTNRKRRSVDCAKTPEHPDCPTRERRSTVESVNCETNQKHPECMRRKRRSDENCVEDDVSCRKRRQACKACEDNPDSTECAQC